MDSVSAKALSASPDLQRRSRETRLRILAATERLLSRRLLEDVTVAEIAKAAGISVGAFYGRFGSKEALVPALQKRYGDALLARVGPLFQPSEWEGLGLQRRLRRFVRLSARAYLRNRGLLRALSLDWRARPREVVDGETRAARAEFHALLRGVLEPARDEIEHADVDAALGFCLQLLGATCRDVLLAPDGHPHPSNFDERAFSAELTRALFAYLAPAGAHQFFESQP